MFGGEEVVLAGEEGVFFTKAEYALLLKTYEGACSALTDGEDKRLHLLGQIDKLQNVIIKQKIQIQGKNPPRDADYSPAKPSGESLKDLSEAGQSAVLFDHDKPSG